MPIDDGVEIGKDCFIESHVTITGGAKLVIVSVFMPIL
jgi:UDP-3-O-[3-hydroxymyristoyl] glucosamine N-acyltransferase